VYYRFTFLLFAGMLAIDVNKSTLNQYYLRPSKSSLLGLGQSRPLWGRRVMVKDSNFATLKNRLKNLLISASLGGL